MNMSKLEQITSLTTALEEIESFSLFFSELYVNFNQIMVKGYLPLRRRLVRSLAKNLNEHVEDIDSTLDIRISGSRLEMFESRAHEIVGLTDGKYTTIKPAQGLRLDKAFELALLYTISIHEALKGMVDIHNYCRNETDEIKKKSRKIKIEQSDFLGSLDRYKRYVKKVVPAFKEKSKKAKDEIVRFNLKQRREIISKNAYLANSKENGFTFQIDLDIISPGTKVGLPVLFNPGENFLDSVEFDATTCLSTKLLGNRSLTLNGCSGILNLSGILSNGRLTIKNSPNLCLEISNSTFSVIEINGAIHKLILSASRSDTLNLSGSVKKIFFRHGAVVGETKLSALSADLLYFNGSNTNLTIKESSACETVILRNSKSSILVDNSKIGAVSSNNLLHLITNNSEVDRISLNECNLSFCFLFNSKIGSIDRNVGSGVYQKITKFRGDQSNEQGDKEETKSAKLIFSSAIGSQEGIEENVILNTIESTDDYQRTSFDDLSEFLGFSEHALKFYRCDPQTNASNISRVILESAPLLLFREGIKLDQTALAYIISKTYPPHRDFTPGQVALCVNSKVAKQFLLWRAENFSQEHGLILNRMQPKTRSYCVKYMNELLWEMKYQREEMLNKETIKFTLNMAWVIFLARQLHFFSHYTPGKYNNKPKIRVKNTLHQEIKDAICNSEDSCKNITNRILQLITECKERNGKLCDPTRTLGTYLSLMERALKKFKRVELLSRTANEVIKHELSKIENSGAMSDILMKHNKDSVEKLLPEAVLETIKSLKRIENESEDPKQKKILQSILSKESIVGLEREVSDLSRLRAALTKVKDFASAYRPVISLWGDGKKKLAAMRQLAEMATFSSETKEQLLIQKSNLEKCLRYLRHDQRQLPTSLLSRSIIIGRDILNKNTREIRGYDATLDRLYKSFTEELCSGIAWPKKQQPQWSYASLPGLGNAIKARQRTFFQFKKDLTGCSRSNLQR